MWTDKAEYIWKTFHFGLHSLIQYFVAHTAYSYFKHQPARAQLVVFMIFGNEKIREFHQHLFNDSFLSLYVAIAVYMVATNRPLYASIFLTLSLSVKAGAMLLVPSFMGWIQYQYGTKKLITAILLIVVPQIIIMLPISFDPFAQLLGFQWGATHWLDYLKYAKFLGGDSDRQYGSDYQWTIYWQIVGGQIYRSNWFAPLLKKLMLGVNVYYFFIRRWCLPQCIMNLLETFSSKPASNLTQRRSRMAIELMLICYVSGVNFVPGGHMQFQMWYWDHLPLAIEMLGLPGWLTFKWFHDIYPCDIRFPIIHHNFSLLLSLWLLTLGPDFFKKFIYK